MMVANQMVAIASSCLHRHGWYFGAAHMRLVRIHEEDCYNIPSAPLHYAKA